MSETKENVKDDIVTTLSYFVQTWEKKAKEEGVDYKFQISKSIPMVTLTFTKSTVGIDPTCTLAIDYSISFDELLYLSRQIIDNEIYRRINELKDEIERYTNGKEKKS